MAAETIPIFGTPEAAAQFWAKVFGVWALSIVFNIGIASWKNKKILFWVIFGFLLGPISTLLLLLSGTKKTPDPEAADTEK